MCKSPCDKHCPRRSATCHAECKEYNDFRNQRNKELEERNKLNDVQTTHPNKMTAIRKRSRWH